MLRLAHRILTQKSADSFLACCRPKEAASNRRGVTTAQAALAAGAPIIVADNVALHLSHDWPIRVQGTNIADLPPCPPPFQCFFAEFNYPSMLVRESGGFCRQGGAMIYSQRGVNDKRTAEAHHQHPETEWFYSIWVFNTDNRGIVSLTHYEELLLDRAAKPIAACQFHLVENVAVEVSVLEVDVVAHTLAFMQCKNVARLDMTKEEGPTPKWCRRAQLPELKYHALQIDPNLAGKPRPDNRKTEGDRSGKSLHICRGHFAHYVDDGVSQGLFGRHQFGTFWVPAHTRGSLEHGRVISTYNVKTPA